MADFKNPYRPGAGHMPPHLAGRGPETKDFIRLLEQETILSNVVLTGLRGVGKTVLLETWKPTAMSKKWLWVGTDFSESTSVSEDTLVIRLLTDLSIVTSGIEIIVPNTKMGLTASATETKERIGFPKLLELYKETPGLTADKLKAMLEFVWKCLQPHGFKGIVFAYDEAQTMSDHAGKDQYPLSMLLDVFQSIQKKDIPFMLVLVGLPTLFPKLVDTRTFSERMFEVITLTKLSPEDSREAIIQPTTRDNCPIQFTQSSVELITTESGGYPYFIQFICRETYDVFLQQVNMGEEVKSLPINEIIRKLDKDFFSGRWGKATDRQRELLSVIAQLDNCDEEFTVQEIVAEAKTLANPFSSSLVNQMLSTLIVAGLIYKNRHGKYSFAVPLLGQFILRQERQANLF
ncbi:MAG: ATP-binding protein, partial [Acidobacteriota bacterium]|nr:ATP-binding protein [Acidobacteriota bacterium]